LADLPPEPDGLQLPDGRRPRTRPARDLRSRSRRQHGADIGEVPRAGL